jgi:hypothetical protein
MALGVSSSGVGGAEGLSAAFRRWSRRVAKAEDCSQTRPLGRVREGEEGREEVKRWRRGKGGEEKRRGGGRRRGKEEKRRR